MMNPECMFIALTFWTRNVSLNHHTPGLLLLLNKTVILCVNRYIFCDVFCNVLDKIFNKHTIIWVFSVTKYKFFCASVYLRSGDGFIAFIVFLLLVIMVSIFYVPITKTN